MKDIKKIIIGAISAVMICGLAAGCGGEGGEKIELGENVVVKESMVVRGYEWGPAVSEIVVEFNDNVSGIDKDTFTVKTGKSERTVLDAYLSDENGNKTTEASKYATVKMSVKYNEASPFTFTFAGSSAMLNDWTKSYNVTLTVGNNFKVGSDTCTSGSYTYNCANNRIIPQTQSWVKDVSTYTPEGGKEITLSRAAWAPEGATTDSGKNPLIIWLHGLGEGGTDIDIDLLGNEVTALTTENETNVQGYFAKDGCAGAYVLAVQAPTMWMDPDGKGSYGTNAVPQAGREINSYYTEALFNAIKTYVEGNDDIDTNRIYLGGCSNGGYMTMNMMFEYGDYFTAFYPVCEAYYSCSITEQMIQQVKDYKIWFVQAENDTTVDPLISAVPTYYRLLNAGAQNVHYTMKSGVSGTDDANASYIGHWSWIYVFNDKVDARLDDAKARADYPNIRFSSRNGKVENSLTERYVKAANNTVKENMWDWLSKQVKG